MEYTGEFAALGAAILWSVSPFIFTSAGQRIGTITLNISRLFVASFMLVITMLILGIPFVFSVNQLIFLVLSGIIGLVLGDTFLFKAFKEIGPRLTMLIMSLNPAIAAVLAYLFLRENLSVYGIVGIFITIIGISLVVLEKPINNNSKFKTTGIGILFGILAAVGQGGGLIVAKLAYVEGYINIFSATLIRILSAAILLVPLAMLIKKYVNPLTVLKNDKKSLGLVVLGSFIGPYLGITLSFISIINTQVGIASTLMSTVPIFMLPLSIIIYKEKLSWKSVIGAIVAFIGVALLFRN